MIMTPDDSYDTAAQRAMCARYLRRASPLRTDAAEAQRTRNLLASAGDKLATLSSRAAAAAYLRELAADLMPDAAAADAVLAEALPGDVA